jgi:hypothetical protein
MIRILVKYVPFREATAAKADSLVSVLVSVGFGIWCYSVQSLQCASLNVHPSDIK